MGLFYTGKGDGGKSVVGNRKIDKTSLIARTVGELDELNSLIGLVKAQKISSEFVEILNHVQENLFIVQANVANFMFGNKYKPKIFNASKISEVETIIDRFEKAVEPARAFIIPGSTVPSAWLDYARAVSRRIERTILEFNKKHHLASEILAYMNRLSSLFFAMARMVSKDANVKENHPKYK